MAGLENCISFVSEDLESPDNIIQNSQNRLRALREEERYISEVALQNVFSSFDENILDIWFESMQEAKTALSSSIFNALTSSWIPEEDIDSISKIDHLFSINGLAPITTSTVISKNNEWKFLVLGSISRLTCNVTVNTVDYLQQESFPFDNTVPISVYGEVIYDFPWSVFGRFNSSTGWISVMTWEVNSRLSHMSREGRNDVVENILANELSHLQFQEAIAPRYWITEKSIFLYQGEEYSFHQVHELWSDFSSLLLSKSKSELSWNNEAYNHELNRLIQLEPWFEQYDLTRIFFQDTFSSIGLSFIDMEHRIIAILESAKN